MAKETFNYKSIPGWGMDMDPENEPTYPMKNYTGDDHKRINYERSPQQPLTVEILKSTERPAPSVVFGTSVPPSGLSGMIRRYAFKHSEDRYRHWLPLILADRINVWEGIVDDISKGHVPNVFAEKGMRATWKHNPRKIIDTVLVGAVVAITLMSVFKKKK